VARTGARTLSTLAVPLNYSVLRSLATGPKRPAELRREVGSPARRTMRDRLRALEAIGAIAKQRRRSVFPRSPEYELAQPGRQLRFVAVALERWLAGAPEEPLELDDEAAAAAIGALVGGWSSTILRALVAAPRSLSELDGRIGALDRPALERRLAALRAVGMVEPVSGGAGDTRYAVNDWLRHGVGPLAAGSRWERDNLADTTAPIDRVDVETGLLMAAPLLQLPPGLAGACRLAVELPDAGEGVPAAVTVVVEDSKVVSCAAPGEGADTWAAGPPEAWFRTAIEADSNHLELGGDRHLARSLVDGLYQALFGRHSRSQIRMP
jgi:DNA-binding HxlR family transcriptional regulator